MDSFLNFTQMPIAPNHTYLSFDDLIDKKLLKIEILIMTTVFILAFVGNLIVILTILIRIYYKSGFRKNKLTRMNFYIFHLSIADVYVSLGNILTMLIWRQNNNIFFGGDLVCRVVVYFQVVSVYYSTYVLISMSIDRYEAICKPFIGLSWSKRRGIYLNKILYHWKIIGIFCPQGKSYIALAFFFAHLQGLPQIGLFSLREIPNLKPPMSTCYAKFDPPWLEKFYVIYTFLMQFAIPLCIIVVCYVSISICSLRSLREGRFVKETSKSIKLPFNDDIELINATKPPTDKKINNISLTLETTNKFASKATCTRKRTSNHKSSQNFSFGSSVQANRKSTDITETFIRRHRAKTSNHGHKFKTIKLTLTVIIMYIFCSTPYFVGVIMSVMISGEYLNSQFLSKLTVMKDLKYIYI